LVDIHTPHLDVFGMQKEGKHSRIKIWVRGCELLGCGADVPTIFFEIIV